MAKAVMTFAAIVLAVGYALSAVLRVYVGAVRKGIRRTYWASVLPCAMISANQWWVLTDQPPAVSRIIFGQSALALLLIFVVIMPTLRILQSPVVEGRTQL